MPERYLTFQLDGPFSSWGDIAVGDQRPSFDRPSKSAIVGLLAAALGLRRPDWRLAPEGVADLDAEHRALASWFYLALRVERAGVYFKDYHTVQVPEGGPYPSRTSELAHTEIGSGGKQTYREYYSGMRTVVCLWPRTSGDAPMVAGAPLTLERLRDSLAAPSFVLYLGRKSNPPGLPLAPRLDGDSIDPCTALTCAAERYAEQIADLPHGWTQDAQSGESIRVYWDDPNATCFGKGDEFRRWDEPASRHRWQFQPRTEYRQT